MDIGKRIKLRREQLGMSQQELADKAGFATRTAISKIENNANGMTQSKIAMVAKALNTTPSYLMGVDEQPQEQYDKEILDMLGSLSKADIQMIKILTSSTEEEKRMLLNIIKAVIDERK